MYNCSPSEMKKLSWPGASLLLYLVFVESTRGVGPVFRGGEQ